MRIDVNSGYVDMPPGLARERTMKTTGTALSEARETPPPLQWARVSGAELALRIDAALDESTVPGTGAWGLRTLDASGSRGSGTIGWVVPRMAVRKHPRSGAPQ